jgi:hypothetical protein
MPKSFGGLIGFVITSIITVAVGVYIINRVGMLRNIVYGKAA